MTARLGRLAAGLARVALLRPRHLALLASAGLGAYCYYAPDATTPERLARWEGRWGDGYIAFHQPKVHPALSANEEALFPGGAADRPHRVLVPLCGKTVDMPHLAAKGHEVVGVDGVALAAEQFAAEQPQLRMGRATPRPPPPGGKADFILSGAFIGEKPGYVYTTRELGTGYYLDAHAPGTPASPPPPLARAGESDWLSAGLTAAARADKQPGPGGGVWLAVRDWFGEHCGRAALGTFGRAWDRGGLVAVPPAMRPAYARRLDELLEPRARLLLVVMEYEQSAAPGPPFAVPEAELRELFPAKRYALKQLGRRDVAPEFRARVGTPWASIGKLDEVTWLVVKRRPWWRRVLWPFGGRAE